MKKKARRAVYFDKTEIVLSLWNGKGYTGYDMTKDQILKITIDKYERSNPYFAFIKTPDERISFTTTKYPGQLILTKGDNKDIYDEHKAEILEYAEKYKIRVDDRSNEDYVDVGF